METIKNKRIMKLYPRGQKTDTEIRMEERKNKLINKWKQTLTNNDVVINDKRKIIIPNIIISNLHIKIF